MSRKLFVIMISICLAKECTYTKHYEKISSKYVNMYTYNGSLLLGHTVPTTDLTNIAHVRLN